MPARDSAMPNAGHSQPNSSGPAGGSGRAHHRGTNECGPPPPRTGTGPAPLACYRGPACGRRGSRRPCRSRRSAGRTGTRGRGRVPRPAGPVLPGVAGAGLAVTRTTWCPRMLAGILPSDRASDAGPAGLRACHGVQRAAAHLACGGVTSCGSTWTLRCPPSSHARHSSRRRPMPRPRSAASSAGWQGHGLHPIWIRPQFVSARAVRGLVLAAGPPGREGMLRLASVPGDLLPRSPRQTAPVSRGGCPGREA